MVRKRVGWSRYFRTFESVSFDREDLVYEIIWYMSHVGLYSSLELQLDFYVIYSRKRVRELGEDRLSRLDSIRIDLKGNKWDIDKLGFLSEEKKSKVDLFDYKRDRVSDLLENCHLIVWTWYGRRKIGDRLDGGSRLVYINLP